MTYQNLSTLLENHFLFKNLSGTERLTIFNTAMIDYNNIYTPTILLNSTVEIRKIVPEHLDKVNLSSINVLDYLIKASPIVKDLSDEKRLMIYNIAQQKIASFNWYLDNKLYTFQTIRSFIIPRTKKIVFELVNKKKKPLILLRQYNKFLDFILTRRNLIVAVDIKELKLKLEKICGRINPTEETEPEIELLLSLIKGKVSVIEKSKGLILVLQLLKTKVLVYQTFNKTLTLSLTRGIVPEFNYENEKSLIMSLTLIKTKI